MLGKSAPMFDKPALNVLNMLFYAESQTSLGPADILKAAATLKDIHGALSVASNEVFNIKFSAIAVGLKGGFLIVR